MVIILAADGLVSLAADASTLPAADAPGSGDSAVIGTFIRRCFGVGRAIGTGAQIIDAHTITTTTIIDTMSATPQSGIKTGRHIYSVSGQSFFEYCP